MRIHSSRGNIALKICISLIAIALLLSLTNVFGGGFNPYAVMLLSILFGVPAALFAILALLAHLGKPMRSADPKSRQYIKVGDNPGSCPNCEATIPVDALECPSCGAIFGGHSAWSVRKQANSDQSTKG